MVEEDVKNVLIRIADTWNVDVPPVPHSLKHAGRRPFRIGVASGLVAAIVLAFGLTQLGRHPMRVQTQGSSAGRHEGLSLSGSAPVPGGVEVPLAQAILFAPFPLLRPQDPAASDDSLVHVWTSTVGSFQAALEYESGVIVLVKQSDGNDPQQNYQTLADQFPGTYVTTINSWPALVLPGSDRAPSVDLTMDGVNIQIQGGSGGLTVGDVLRIAESTT
jgi:hypothetical protein